MRIQRIWPSCQQAVRLAETEALAFPDRAAAWGADAFRSPNLLIMADSALETCHIALQLSGPDAEIVTLAVKPSARRQRLGSQLLTLAAPAAADHGATRMILEVAADNVAALALYQRHDYRPVGQRKAYYRMRDGSRMDAIVMAKDLVCHSA